MTAPHGLSAHAPQHIHPPKVELFDPDTMTSTDLKGRVRVFREYRVEPFGLYLARDYVDHASIYAMESWLLPEIGLRITDKLYASEHPCDGDYKVDVARIDVEGRCWRTEDLYLDLVVRPGRGVDVLDTDELLDAVLAGLLDRSVAQQALATTYWALDGLARHGYQLDRWLSTLGVAPTWSRSRH
ncbi:MAG: DUF402 domain-containing protein [Pseudonocardiaceae bacterium]